MPAASARSTPGKPVRQARQARSKATVDSIVEAAARILAEEGWPDLNTNAIARRAGVSVGSVYEYFADKQAIIDLIIDRHLARGEALLAEAANALVANPSVNAVVDALVSGFIRLHQDDPRLHRVLSSEVPVSPVQRARVDALRARIVSVVASALTGHVESPELKANLVVDTTDALSHRWLVDGVGIPVSADVMAAEASRMLKGYLAAD